jgi:catechol 2,3-dioxygenase-like lactoylglutathione lyase family enzyme
MDTVPARLKRIDHVELRVRDLAQSEAFYEKLLGLTRDRAREQGDDVGVYLSDAADAAFSIVLVEGVPNGMEMIGLDHICLEVESKRDVDVIHAAARSSGTQTTVPRFHQKRYQTYVFDPNGYKIEIAAHSREGSSQRHA